MCKPPNSGITIQTWITEYVSRNTNWDINEEQESEDDESIPDLMLNSLPPEQPEESPNNTATDIASDPLQRAIQILQELLDIRSKVFPEYTTS